MEASLPMVLKMLLQTAGPDIEKLLREKLFLEVVPDKVSDALASSLDANGTKWVQGQCDRRGRARRRWQIRTCHARRGREVPALAWAHGRRLGRRQHQRRASGRAAQRRVTCTRSRASLTGQTRIDTTDSGAAFEITLRSAATFRDLAGQPRVLSGPSNLIIPLRVVTSITDQCPDRCRCRSIRWRHSV
jgi:hypothetical protein